MSTLAGSAVTDAKIDHTSTHTKKIAGILSASAGWNYIAIDQTAKQINIRTAAVFTGVGSGVDPLQIGIKSTSSGTPTSNISFTDAYITVNASSGTAGGDPSGTRNYFARSFNAGSGAVSVIVTASLFANNVAISKAMTYQSNNATQYDGIAVLTSGIASNGYLGINATVAGSVYYEIEYIY